jgi:hypothetical protein
MASPKSGRTYRFDPIVDTNLDNCLNVEILGNWRLVSIQFKGLVTLVAMLSETICGKNSNIGGVRSKSFKLQNNPKILPTVSTDEE